MGWAFVKRRMQAELGADWQPALRLASSTIRPRPPRSARCIAPRAKDGSPLACKLQYPDMQSAVEADLAPAADAVRHPPPHGPGHRHARDRRGDRRAGARGARLSRARRSMPRSMRDCSTASTEVRAPRVWPRAVDRSPAHHGLARRRALLDFKEAPLEIRNRLASAMFTAWWKPFQPRGVIHGDPHLGNYTVFEEAGEPRRHQPPRLWLHPHLPPAIRRRRRRPLSRPPRQATTPASSTPTRPGASAACATS